MKHIQISIKMEDQFSFIATNGKKKMYRNNNHGKNKIIIKKIL